MTILLGDEAPDFVAETTEGEVPFREWKRDRWALLFSHPGDFTPVCTTELAAVAALKSEFDERDTKVMAVSVDPVDSHYRWLSAVERLAGCPVTFPIAADPNRWISSLYGMIHPRSHSSETVRSAFVIDPDDRVRFTVAYPASTGRNFKELLRVIDSLRLYDRHGVATPSDWQRGQDVVIPIEMSSAEAEDRFPGFEAKLPYLRMISQPDVEESEAEDPDAKGRESP